MRQIFHRCLVFGAGAVIFFSAVAFAQSTTATLAWPEPTQSAKPWLRWWWPGSAVDPANLTRELEAFAAAGFGGVEITPIYGARGAEDKYLDFLSPQYIQMLDHTTREANRLGLGLDMATGTGWPFGGPHVTTATAMLSARLENNALFGRPSGMKVKRPAPGGEGLVIDPYSTPSLLHYLEPFAAALPNLSPGGIRAQFHDSFEYYGATFSPGLPDRFRAMHGYDLQTYAPQLLPPSTATLAIDPDTLARVRADYRATLAAMHLDFIRDWAAWSRARGFLARNQSHGAPANLLDLYAAVDIPETEMFGASKFDLPGLRRDPANLSRDSPDPLVMRMASSAAHVMNKPLVSCESLTWLREHWHETFAAAKPELDQAFLAGVNHVFYHGTCFSPADAPWPGWFFYASTQINDRNPLWRDIDAFNAYVTRVQSLLQLGRPDNDVLLYWPAHDLWHDENPRASLTRPLTVHNPEWLASSPCGRLAQRLENNNYRAYSFDFISDAQIAALRVENQMLLAPGGNYRLLVVPAVSHMPHETLFAILQLVQDGATVIFEQMPQDVPGFADLDRRRALFNQYRDLLYRQFVNRDRGQRRGAPGSGWILVGDPIQFLESNKLASFENFARFDSARFIRRSHDNGHLYFIASPSAMVNHGDWATLSVPFASAALMDPQSGRISLAHTRTEPDGRSSVYFRLSPGKSLFIWTSTKEKIDIPRLLDDIPGDHGVVLNNLDWRIEFIAGGPDIPDPVTTKTLVSWTALPDPRAQNFAGAARYSASFDLPRFSDRPERWHLDLGDVRETARLRLNGHDLGTLWYPPYRVNITGLLQPTQNTLEIEVTSLAANRIRDLDRRDLDWKIMRDANIVNVHYRPLNAAQWPATPTGLLGPISLTYSPDP